MVARPDRHARAWILIIIIDTFRALAGGRSKSGERAGRLLSVRQGDDDAEQDARPDGGERGARPEETELLEAVRVQRGIVLRLVRRVTVTKNL